MLVTAIALAACKGEDELPPAAEISPLSLDFGAVPLGSEAERSVDVTNAGGGTLEVLSATITLGEVDVWGSRADGPLLVEAGATTPIAVIFSPEDLEPVLGTLQIRTSDPSASAVQIDLSGSGAPSETDEDGDGVSPADGDCDDDDDRRFPGNDEACDGVDNDCDGDVPDDEADDDDDGVRVCEDDCDDDDDAVGPGFPEICDDKDSDCDGVNSDRNDLDGDEVTVCDGDCDDDDDTAFPGATEACDGADNDCSGGIDDLDVDGDGHSPCSFAGDCDDTSDARFPVVVDGESDAVTPDGTDAAPFRDLASAMGALDGDCNQIVVAAGEYHVELVLDGDTVHIVGDGEVSFHPPEDGDRMFTATDSTLVLEAVTLTGGAVAGDGGAILADGGVVECIQATFRGNSATGDGGAIAISSGAFTARQCVLDDNHADDDGGAVALLSGTMSDVNGSTWTANDATRGGALLADASDIHVAGARFDGNHAATKGGAIAVVGGTASRLELNRLWNNTSDGTGGALQLDDATGLLVRNNRVQDNDAATDGGGVAIGGTVAAGSVHNNTLTADAATESGACVAITAADLTGFTFAANVIHFCHAGTGLDAPASSAIAYNTVFATTAGPDFSAGLEDADENRSENPAFMAFTDDANPANDDLRPTSGSPLRDSGPPDSAWNDPDNSTNDRGYTGGPGAP